jgi:hypothetical protein
MGKPLPPFVIEFSTQLSAAVDRLDDIVGKNWVIYCCISVWKLVLYMPNAWSYALCTAADTSVGIIAGRGKSGTTTAAGLNPPIATVARLIA